ncbi:uncharacterized protein LOC105701561 [Orussus abietinus]|uniref:uncharacterized protein LOC105701561 n=1 Tax=Orussus abietinus TaxID=222816 RepID=UPI0006250C39|nr:uncharacterized protein LOC105701561 [Orussus abietinus]
MAENRDDPREVLALLNSLGFVGITGPQLKAFMKDLKMYRKIKERERQQWKEETKHKILSKQQHMCKELLRECTAEMNLNVTESTVSSTSSAQEESTVRIKVRYHSDDKENKRMEEVLQRHCLDSKMSEQNVTRKPFNFQKEEVNNRYDKRLKESSSNTDTLQCIKRSRSKVRVHVGSLSRVDAAESRISEEPMTRIGRAETTEKDSAPKMQMHQRPGSAPELARQNPPTRPKSSASDPIGVVDRRSSSRTRQKSFIRPWRLHAEAQKSVQNKKSDPVALYQKYQHEWKQLSLPGENYHPSVRWAIRERMLGMDPNPMPIPKKTSSTTIMKKR